MLASIRSAFPWLRHIFADGGYAGPKLKAALAKLGQWTLETIVRERGAGFFSNEPGEVAEQLVRWLEIKQDKGLLPPVPESARANFSRDELTPAWSPSLRT